MYKFPLVELDTSASAITKTLAAVGIESSETLTLEPRDQIVQLTRGIPPPPKPVLELKEIPDDNSCLFNAIGFVLENQSLSKAYELRSSNLLILSYWSNYLSLSSLLVVAQYILARPLSILQLSSVKNPEITLSGSSNRTSGAVPLNWPFSVTFTGEIGSFDVQSGRMDLFGEGRGYRNRVYLQYTGIHYEAFYQTLNKEIITVFPASDPEVTDQIRELVMAARAAHKYTDTLNLHCDVVIVESVLKDSLKPKSMLNKLIILILLNMNKHKGIRSCTTSFLQSVKLWPGPQSVKLRWLPPLFPTKLPLLRLLPISKLKASAFLDAPCNFLRFKLKVRPFCPARPAPPGLFVTLPLRPTWRDRLTVVCAWPLAKGIFAASARCQTRACRADACRVGREQWIDPHSFPPGPPTQRHLEEPSRRGEAHFYGSPSWLPRSL